MATRAHPRATARLPREERLMRVKDPTPLERCRILKGWSQRQVATLCGRSQNAYHLLESGKSKTIGQEFALDLFRNLEINRLLGLTLQDVFEDIPDSLMPEVLSASLRADGQVSA